jgi:hypothetical protein
LKAFNGYREIVGRGGRQREKTAGLDCKRAFISVSNAPSFFVVRETQWATDCIMVISLDSAVYL